MNGMRSKLIDTSIFSNGQWEIKQTCIIGEASVTLTVKYGWLSCARQLI